MSETAYIATNLIDADTVISSSTEDSDYPLENLFDERLALVFRFTSSSGGYVEFDLLSAQSFDTIAILNLPQASSIIVKAGATPNPSTTIATPIWQEGGVWADLGAQSARYVRVTVVFLATDFPQIGMIVLNTRTALTPYSFRFGYEAGVEEANLERETERGVMHVYRQFSRDLMNIEWRVQSAQLALLRALHVLTGGRDHPFIFIPDTGAAIVLYCRKEAGFRYRNVPGRTDVFDYSMQLTGESAGVDILA